MSHILYFWLFLKASLLSTGGLGNLPSLRDDFLARHMATDREFAESLIIGQLSPGPNGLWVISLGYLTAGVPGSVLALLGTCSPPLLVVLIEKIYRRIQSHPGVEGFVQGLTLAVSGIFLVVLSLILRTSGINFFSCLIALAALALTASKKVPIPAILALAAVAGITLKL